MDRDLKFNQSLRGWDWPPRFAPNSKHRSWGEVGFASAVNKGIGSAAAVMEESAVHAADLRKVRDSLLTSFDGVRALLWMPHLFSEHMERAVQLSRIAAERTGAERSARQNEPEFRERLNRGHVEYLRLRASMHTNDPPRENSVFASEEINLISKGGDGWDCAIRVGFAAVLNAAILDGWTAFESCATDLWIAAVNVRPNTLARNVLEWPTTAKRDPSDGAGQRNAEPRIRYSDLAAYDFDVTRSMGLLLKSSSRVRFDSLWDIQTAYFDAFRLPQDRRRRTSTALTGLFEERFSALKCLEAIRNLLAHRSGIVDGKFLADVKGHSATLEKLPLGSRFPVDGEIVAEGMKTLTEASLSLLNFVADWLAGESDEEPMPPDGQNG